MLQTEIRILRKLDHSCIVQLYDIVETKKFLYIVMEKCAGGELFDQIAELDGEHYNEQDSCMVMHQIAAGVRYMHSVGIVHRDLKPENVLCVHPNSIRKVKIADFGISKMLKNRSMVMKTMVGTLSYTAPEILQRKRKYDYTVDYWSVGVIMYILLCGYPPFWGDTDDEIIGAIVKSEPEFDMDEWGHVQPGTIELVRGLLSKNPSDRKTLDDILQLTWKVSSQSLSFQKSRMRLKRRVLDRKMRAMSSSVYESNPGILSGMAKRLELQNHSSRKQKSRTPFCDDMSPAFDRNHTASSFAKMNRRKKAFRGQRHSKGTEELYHDLTELTLPMYKRDSMMEPADSNYNGR
jgi:serine/threonine protein kinase